MSEGNSSTIDRQNISLSEVEPDARDEYLARWEVVVLSVIFIVTVIGNFLVLFALYLRRYHGYRGKKKLTRMYFFIMHLNVADLLTALLNVLPQLFWDVTYRFRGGPFLCKVVKYGQPLGPYLSSYVLTVTALDRYQAIRYPLSYCTTTSRRSRIMVYSAWLLSLTLCFPQIAVFSYQEVTPGIWDCWATFLPPYGERIYVTWYCMTVFALPLCVLIYTYMGICIGIWKNNNAAGGEAGSISKGEATLYLRHSKSPIISRARISTVKQTIAVISLYIVSNSPFIGCQLWATWDPEAAKSPFLTGAAFTIFALMSSLSSCVNPWIYLALNRELRQKLVQKLCWSKLQRTYRPAFDNSNMAPVRRGSPYCSSGTSDTSQYTSSRISHLARTISQTSSSKD